MSIFRAIAWDEKTDKRSVYYIDNRTLRISEEFFETEDYEIPDITAEGFKAAPVHVLKIQLGLNCNYDCGYCSQRFSERSPYPKPDEVDNFVKMLEQVEFRDSGRVEFWGGEPMLYWKVIEPLSRRLRVMFPRYQFVMITNGSLLTHEVVDWAIELDVHIGISHDGPGQAVRGPDPLDTNFEVINRLLREHKRTSISSVLNAHNYSRTNIIDFFAAKFPGVKITHAELDIADTYDSNSTEPCDLSFEQHFEIRRRLWVDMRKDERVLEKAYAQRNKIVGMLDNIKTGRLPVVRGQKCGMDQPGRIAVDIQGNLLTCQNVSATTVSGNGEVHKIGHILDMKKSALKTVTHWKDRPNCPTCPALVFCEGSCMFLQGDNFERSCETSYDTAITELAIVFEAYTGLLLESIESPNLPEHRADIWGSQRDYGETVKRKVIPIKVVK